MEPPQRRFLPGMFSYSFLKKIRNVILTIAAIIVLCSISRPTLILDSKSHSPISGSTITYKKVNWANGCGNDVSKRTNSTGTAFFFGLFSSCQLTVTKDGYHTNGANILSTLPGLFGFRIVFLNRIENPQTPVYFARTFEPNSGMDASSYLHDINPNVSPSEMLGDKVDDFTFTQVGTISSSSIYRGKVGDPILSIQFSGDGGVQETSKDDTKGDAGGKFYDLENLIIAPTSGYSKELTLQSGKSYIARLKDGKRYMEFYMIGSCMSGFIEQYESQHLEFTNVLDLRICQLIDNSPNFDLKNKYLSLQKELTGKHTIDFGMYYQGHLDLMYLKEYSGIYSFGLAPNDGRFSNVHSPIAIRSLNGLSVDVKVPPLDIFNANYDPYGTKIPIDVFLDGKYLDPTTVTL